MRSHIQRKVLEEETSEARQVVEATAKALVVA